MKNRRSYRLEPRTDERRERWSERVIQPVKVCTRSESKMRKSRWWGQKVRGYKPKDKRKMK